MEKSEEWDLIFSKLDGETPAEHSSSRDAWLGRWRHVLEAGRGSSVLDLGCGAGQDAHALAELGFSVVAADFSEKALEITRREAPTAKTERVDLTRGLPFPDASFGIIVASLSLHYFPWRKTTRILKDVRRCLEPGGYLLARLNSTRDPYYSAVEKQEVENNFYLVEKMPKRLFDEHDVDALFETGWEVSQATERLTRGYGGEKLAWEVAAKRAES